MRLNNYVVCKDILGIRTNSKYIGWSFGHPSESVSDEEVNSCRIVVSFIVDPLREEFKNLEGLEKYHYWRGTLGRDELFYQRNFLAGTKLRMLVRGIRSEYPETIVNKNFLKFIRFRFNNLHSPGYHLTDLVCALLLQNDLCPLHCSGFKVGDYTVAVVAPPDTGKTLATMRAVFDAEASFISEDLGITDGVNLFACPWTSTFRYYDELSMSWILRARMKLVKVFPPVELIPVPGDSRKINSYVKNERILSRSKITHLAILARRSGGIELLSKDRARRMLFNLNRYEFMYMKNPMLTAYSYFNPEFDVGAFVDKERDILSKLVDNATCVLVKSKDPTKISEILLAEITKSNPRQD